MSQEELKTDESSREVVVHNLTECDLCPKIGLR